MGRFSVGTKVKEKIRVQGFKTTGKIVKVKKASWGKTIYNVKYPGSNEIYEYHIGELKSVKYK